MPDERNVDAVDDSPFDTTAVAVDGFHESHALWPDGGPARVPFRIDGKVAHRCAFGVVWCTQYKAPVLRGAVLERMEEIVSTVLAHRHALLVNLEIKPDYVYLTVAISPQFGIHRLVKAVKARTAHLLRDEFPELRSRMPSLWTNAYLVTTVGRGLEPIMIDHFVAQQNVR
jgi:putative transposase